MIEAQHARQASRPDIVDEIQVGEFHGLEPKGPSDNALDVGLWRSDPATYDYLFESEYFRPGTRSVWKITQPFKKFVVIAN